MAQKINDLEQRLLQAYRHVEGRYDPSMWWRDPTLLRDLVTSLAALHSDDPPSVVAGPESRGLLLGALVAQQLNVGFVEIRKDEHPEALGEALYRRTTPPDYRDLALTLTMRRHVVGPRDHVLLVDDWIETGAQVSAARSLVSDAGARWIGAAVIVDAVSANVRRSLNVRSVLRVQQLP